MKSPLEFLKDVGVPLLAVAATVLGIYLTHRGNLFEGQLRATEVTLAGLDAVRQDRESRQELSFRLYDTVKSSLEKNDPRMQEVAKVLVYTMADSIIRESLLHALGEGAVPTVRRDVQAAIVAESQFRVADDSLRRRPPSGTSRIVCDVFWCEGLGPTGSERGTALAGAIRREFGWTVRVRMLPRSVNLRPGYWVNGNEIRFDPDESQIADRLRRVLDREPASRAPFTQRVVGAANRTQNYLSVFLCGN